MVLTSPYTVADSNGLPLPLSASGRPLHCEVHLELLSKYQENQTVTTLKEVDGWSLRKDTLSASEFSRGDCRVSW